MDFNLTNVSGVNESKGKKKKIKFRFKISNKYEKNEFNMFHKSGINGLAGMKSSLESMGRQLSKTSRHPRKRKSLEIAS